MTFAITAATPAAPGFSVAGDDTAAPQPGFNQFIQWRADGVDVGDRQVRVIDLIDTEGLITATRGVGDNAHIVTIRANAPPAVPTVFVEDFEHSLAEWSLAVGSGSTYSLVFSAFPPLTVAPYESPERALLIAGVTSNQHVLRRTIPFIPSVGGFRIKFRIGSLPGATNNSSSASFSFKNGTITFFPRGAVNVTAGRPYLLMSGGSAQPVVLPAFDTWYMAKVTIVPGVGNSFIEIFDLSGGLPGVLESTTFLSGSIVPVTFVNELDMATGTPGANMEYPTNFDDIELYAD